MILTGVSIVGFLDPSKGMFISESGFRNALYMIDIGQNDIARSFSLGNSYSQTVKLIPQFISEIKTSIKVKVSSLMELWYAPCKLIKPVLRSVEIV